MARPSAQKFAEIVGPGARQMNREFATWWKSSTAEERQKRMLAAAERMRMYAETDKLPGRREFWLQQAECILQRGLMPSYEETMAQYADLFAVVK